jgi:hypothetical protein
MGSFVVVAMQGLGSAVVYSFTPNMENQFTSWSLYPLFLFICVIGIVQINYLNKALNIFSTAIVTPIYYVCFTTATLACSAVLFRDFNFPSAIAGASALIGFFVIVGGVALLFAYSMQLQKLADAAAELMPEMRMERSGSVVHPVSEDVLGRRSFPARTVSAIFNQSSISPSSFVNESTGEVSAGGHSHPKANLDTDMQMNSKSYFSKSLSMPTPRERKGSETMELLRHSNGNTSAGSTNVDQVSCINSPNSVISPIGSVDSTSIQSEQPFPGLNWSHNGNDGQKSSNIL